MPRVHFTARIFKEYDELITKRAEQLCRSKGFILESMVDEFFKDEKPRHLQAGKKVPEEGET